MTWDELAIDMLKAAQMLLDTHPRSSASRAYYAAHIALAKTLEAHGYVPQGGQTPPHKKQKTLIGQYLSGIGQSNVKELNRLFTRLYGRRIDSDYIRQVTIDRSIARDSIRDASSVFRSLKMPEVS